MMLVAKVGNVVCAIPIAHVVETMRPLPIEPVHGAGVPQFVAGLAIVRGAPIPVVDAAILLGVTGAAPTRFVIVRTGDRRVALAVEAVLDVRALEASAFAGLPPLLASAPAEVTAAIGALDGQLVAVLDNARLVPADAWLALGRAEASA